MCVCSSRSGIDHPHPPSPSYQLIYAPRAPPCMILSSAYSIHSIIMKADHVSCMTNITNLVWLHSQ